MNVLVNADDFGASPSVNAAIVRAFDLQLIDRTTAIANARYFPDSLELARTHGFADRVGIHFNITEGSPASSRIAQHRRFCSTDGAFSFRRNAGLVFSRSEMAAVSAECEAQIVRFHEQGMKPNHFDSHHHVHTEWLIWRAVEPVLRNHAFVSVRLSNNVVPSSMIKRSYKAFFNEYLKRRRWASSDLFGDFSDFVKWPRPSMPMNTSIEIMCHPDLDSNGMLIDALSGRELVSELQYLTRLV